MKRYLMIRAMTSQEIHFKEFFDNSVVAVGWSNVDFTSFSAVDDLIEAVKQRYYPKQGGSHIAKNSMNVNVLRVSLKEILSLYPTIQE